MTVAGTDTPLDDHLELVVNGPVAAPGLDLFNTREFHELHRVNASRGYYFVLRNRRSGTALGAVHFLESTPAHFESPWRGSFGGFAMIPGTHLPIEDMERFVAGVESFLHAEGAQALTVVFPPLAYHPGESSAWINVLWRAGFTMLRHELNYALDVGEPFLSKLDAGNRKRIAQCQRAGLVTRRLLPTAYENAYKVIAENRRKKGRTPSMTWEALEEMGRAFSGSMRCFGVHRDHDDELIAAAITLVINPDVLYVFYWGEISGVETLSPVTLLANHLYDHCLDQKIALLDIGTGTEQGVPNHGLIRYKKNLGCRESLKLTMHKVLS